MCEKERQIQTEAPEIKIRKKGKKRDWLWGCSLLHVPIHLITNYLLNAYFVLPTMPNTGEAKCLFYLEGYAFTRKIWVNKHEYVFLPEPGKAVKA